ncbi:DMT family transporter [Salinibacterium sp. ZJ454]|uniref:DMT family transporter n=1 Tax=Salinibacterium sp. ZJ454 TaxID=2708339 RepID=UPI00141DC6A3|nr:DMT family transporter [Salinibacterium sp. ZJ454]
MKSVVFLVLATLFWAGNFVAGEAAVASITPLDLTFLRWLLALIPLLVIAQLTEKPDWRAVWRQWPLHLLLAALGLAGFNLLLYVALQYTSALNASLINAVNPALLAVLGVLLFKERIGCRGVLGIAIGLFGVVVVLTDGQIGAVFSRTPNFGDLLMIGAIVVWSFYTLLGRRLRGVPPITATAMQALFVVVGLAPFTIAAGGVRFPTETAPLLALLYIAVFASVGSYVFWNAALRSVPPSRAGIYLNLIAVFTALIGLAIGTPISLVQVIGGALVIGGVVLTSLLPRRIRQPQGTSALG